MGALFLGPAVAFAAFVALPLIALGYRAFDQEDFASRLTDDFTLQALRLSVITSTVTLVIALVLGTPLAYLLARSNFRGKRIVDSLIDLPIVLPPTVAGVALLVAFGRRGYFGQYLDDLGLELAFTTNAVILAQLFVAAPFLVRSLKAGFESIDPAYEQVSATLGVSPLLTFWRITLRLARPSLIGGAVLCWARALSELGATLIFAGNFSGRTQTMPLAIITAFESRQGLAGAVALSVILLAVAFVLLLALRYALSGRELYRR
ncbi:MAG: molybdate ABC transporter permease subunit [Dehalococcoidia bacterium]|nr:molybdate ABC transporter permease subunit [Dehalococcoidia bacterium]